MGPGKVRIHTSSPSGATTSHLPSDCLHLPGSRAAAPSGATLEWRTEGVQEPSEGRKPPRPQRAAKQMPCSDCKGSSLSQAAKIPGGSAGGATQEAAAARLRQSDTSRWTTDRTSEMQPPSKKDSSKHIRSPMSMTTRRRSCKSCSTSTCLLIAARLRSLRTDQEDGALFEEEKEPAAQPPGASPAPTTRPLPIAIAIAVCVQATKRLR